MRRLAAWVAAAFASISFQPAVAFTEDADFYSLHWTVGQAEPRVGPFWVKEQRVVVETRLWPSELYRVERDVLDRGGKKLLPAGAQLGRLQAQLYIACNLVAGQTLGYSSASKRVCLVDQDGDGTLDSYFERGTGGSKWYDLSGNVPRRLSSLGEVSIVPIEPTEFRDSPILALHYERYLDQGNVFQRVMDRGSVLREPPGDLIRFFFTVGRETGRGRFWHSCDSELEPHACASGPVPSNFTFLGVQLDILERRGEDLLFRVRSNFEPKTIRILTLTDKHTPGGLVVVD